MKAINIIIGFFLAILLLIYTYIDSVKNWNPFSIAFFVAMVVLLLMATITINKFWPNSKISSFIDKIGEWIRDSLTGL